MDAAFAEWQMPLRQPGDSWQETVAVAARQLWHLFRRHLWLAPAYSLTRPLVVTSGLTYTEHVLSTCSGAA